MPGSARRIGAGSVAASTLILLVAFGFGPVLPVLASGPRPAGLFLPGPPPGRTGSVHRMPFAPPTVTFYGRGYGPGPGLSQSGARGRALAGQTAPTILAHYYQGTTLAGVSPAAPVRVLVLALSAPTAAKPIVLHG